jgi:hypothetical protein
MAQQPFTHKTGGDNQWTTDAIGRHLLTPMGVRTMWDLVNLNEPDQAKSECHCLDNDGLAAYGLGSNFLGIARGGFPWQVIVIKRGVRWPLIARVDNPVTDGEIVSIALGWAHWTEKSTISPKPLVLNFMRNMVSEVSAAPQVRGARIAVNFFVGVERLAILVVSTFLVFCLLWQQWKGIRDSRDLRYIREVIDVSRSRDPSVGTREVLLVKSLNTLRRLLYRDAGRSGPREVLDAALEMVAQKKKHGSVDHDRLRRASEHELRIVDRNRFFFLVGLPLLPTIGFIGTVHSLIEALAIADNIPRARDAVDQVAAVSGVTATLSLCFSTTFMALTALLVFAPLDLWQNAHERRMIEETERLLDDSLLARL